MPKCSHCSANLAYPAITHFCEDGDDMKTTLVSDLEATLRKEIERYRGRIKELEERLAALTAK